MNRNLCAAAAFLVLSATGLFGDPSTSTTAVAARPCRNITIILVNTDPPTTYRCHCNDGTICTPDPGVPHCEGPYAPYCWATAPPTSTTPAG